MRRRRACPSRPCVYWALVGNLPLFLALLAPGSGGYAGSGTDGRRNRGRHTRHGRDDRRRLNVSERRRRATRRPVHEHKQDTRHTSISMAPQEDEHPLATHGGITTGWVIGVGSGIGMGMTTSGTGSPIEGPLGENKYLPPPIIGDLILPDSEGGRVPPMAEPLRVGPP